MNSFLYQLRKEISTILDSVEDSGELSPEQFHTLCTFEQNVDVLLEELCKAVRTVGAQCTALYNEECQFRRRARQKEALLKDLKDAIISVMHTLQIEGKDVGLFRVRLQAGPPSTVVDPSLLDMNNLDALPPELVRVEKKLNLRAILALHGEGKPLPPGVTVVRNKHLRINTC